MLNVPRLYPLLLGMTKGDPESAHRQLMSVLHWLDSSSTAWGNWGRTQIRSSFGFKNPQLSQTVWGLEFANPLGLAAGCDKNAQAPGLWSEFGFGFAELGAVTFQGQPGNPRPRLFRLPEDQAVLNRLGANNSGATAIAENLQAAWRRRPRTIPIGINLCKSKLTSLEDAPKDYLGSFQRLQNLADFFVINVSSPNTPGLRSLQATESLKPILDALWSNNTNQQPILLKIAPDLSWEDISELIQLVKNFGIAGIVATNTTIRRDILKTKILPETGQLLTEENGGISGAPLRSRSTEIIRFIYQETEGKIPIVGVGGIFTAEDAWEKITAGASLLQAYTGWIYKGPSMVKQILQGLTEKLEQHQLTSITQAIGLDTKKLNG
ncbi:MAG: quinone-dependent dihydroorotate dehydrogenase [Cyanobacteria bacterium P01_H01_bin.15]